MKNEDIEDVGKLLYIKNQYLFRNKNIVYGLLRFLLGPLLALIISDDHIRYFFIYFILFYFYSILFYFILFYFILFYFIFIFIFIFILFYLMK